MIKLNAYRTNRILMSTLASIALLAFYIANALTSWIGLKSSEIRGPSNYIDQVAISGFSNCFKTYGYDIYKTHGNPPGCSGYQYSVELLRILNFMRVPEINPNILGFFSLVITTLALSSVFFMIRKNGKKVFTIAFIACASPGIWLLLERGNYDEFVFILVILAAFSIGSRAEALGMLAIIIATLMKFYTFPVIIFMIIVSKNKILKYMLATISIPIFFYAIILISKVSQFPSTWNVSFGLKALGMQFELVIKHVINSEFQLSGILTNLLGIVAISFFYFFLRRFELRPSLRQTEFLSTDKAVNTYNFCLVVFLSCYFAGMNYDYRLIFLAVIVALSPVIYYENRFSTILVMSGLVALLCSCFLYGLVGIPALLIQISGDISLAIFVAAQLLFIISKLQYELKQMTPFRSQKLL